MNYDITYNMLLYNIGNQDCIKDFLGALEFTPEYLFIT